MKCSNTMKRRYSIEVQGLRNIPVVGSRGVEIAMSSFQRSARRPPTSHFRGNLKDTQNKGLKDTQKEGLTIFLASTDRDSGSSRAV